MVTSEAIAFAFLGLFLGDAVNVEIVVSAFALVGGEEFDGGVYGEHEASDITLIG